MVLLARTVPYYTLASDTDVHAFTLVVDQSFDLPSSLHAADLYCIP
jgi:hypothetical protein